MEKIFRFSCENINVSGLNPGDLFVYKNSIWLSINRSQRGYLSSKFNIDRISEIIPYEVVVERIISSSEV
jgi:hypothetical protein